MVLDLAASTPIADGVTLVELKLRIGDQDYRFTDEPVLLGALETTEWSSEIFGPDAERMEKARTEVVAALGDAAATARATGERFNAIESVHFAVARLKQLVTGPEVSAR